MRMTRVQPPLVTGIGKESQMYAVFCILCLTKKEEEEEEQQQQQ